MARKRRRKKTTSENKLAEVMQRGLDLHQNGQLNEAAQIYEQVLLNNPRHFEALKLLGILAYQNGDSQIAIELISQFIAINSNHAEAHYNLGVALSEQGKLEEAIQSYQRALIINPNHAEAHNNLGVVLSGQGKLEEAIQSHQRALVLHPNYAKAHNNLIFIQDFLPDNNLEKQQLERQKWNQRFILPLCNQHQPYSNQADPDRPLRIGYVSADFRRHSAAIGFADLILNYDKKLFQVYCYSGVEKHREDDMTIRLQQNASVWRPTKGLKDIELVEQIRNDKNDILVDLSGHTGGNRQLAFGYKPASIQMTGIGHSPPGLSTIDYRYRLTNRFSTFPEEQQFFPEQPIYLDYIFGFYLHQIRLAVSLLPAKGNGFLTFGCLNRWRKVSSTTQALWGRLLLAIPNSRLILKAPQLANESLRGSILGQMKEFGVSEERIDLRGRTSQQEHLAVYQEIDISLDPFPYGGGISSMESAWMGVPVISLSGDGIASRAGATTLYPLGLEDWVVTGESEYIELAQDWNQRRGELEQLRSDGFEAAGGRAGQDLS